MEKTKAYNLKDIAKAMDLNFECILSRRRRRKIKPIEIIKGKNFYSISQFLKNTETVVIYYPLKTTETFYIYESKLNTMEL